jgi:hypothetical protein
MSWIDFVGYLAALMVLATFCMDTIVPLRGLAIASNVLFILYGHRRTALSRASSSRRAASGQHRKDRPAAAASATRRRQANRRGPAAPRRAIARLDFAAGSSPPMKDGHGRAGDCRRNDRVALFRSRSTTRWRRARSAGGRISAPQSPGVGIGPDPSVIHAYWRI